MLALILFWGSSFVVVQTALREGLTPIALATFRFLIAGGLFLIGILFEKKRNGNYRLAVDKKDAPTFLVLSLTGVTFFFIIQYTGIELAGPSIASILVCLLSPVLISLFSAMLFKESLTRRQILGIGTAALGTLIVITGSFQGGRDFIYGSLILLLTPFLWATYTLVGKKIMEKYDPFLTVAYVNMLGGLLLAPFSLVENSFHLIFTLSLNGWFAVLFLSITCSLLAYYIWFHVISQAGASLASSFMFAEPLITVLVAVAFVGEKVTLCIPLGGLLIFTGVLLVTRK
jgi:drug/metabolite transporter (DMT)-like permease